MTDQSASPQRRLQTEPGELQVAEAPSGRGVAERGTLPPLEKDNRAACREADRTLSPSLPRGRAVPFVDFKSQRAVRGRAVRGRAGGSSCRKSALALGPPTAAGAGAAQSPRDLGRWGPVRGRHDPLHPHPEPGGQDAPGQVVHAVRRRREAEADRGGARRGHRARRQAHQLRGVPQLQDHLPALRRPLLLHLRGRQRQQPGLPGGHPQLCGGLKRVFP